MIRIDTQEIIPLEEGETIKTKEQNKKGYYTHKELIIKAL